MPKLGIVGFPNVGKTTIFNALTGLEAVAAPHPFTTTSPNRGVALVPDPDLDRIATIEGSKKTVYTGLELLDLPAFTGSIGGEDGNRAFLGKLTDMDAIVVVLRAFENPAVPNNVGAEDAQTQAEEIFLELVSADFEVFSRRAEKIRKEATVDPTLARSAAAITTATQVLGEGRPLSSESWDEISLAAFRDMAPLTLLPIIWVLNVSEEEENTTALLADLSESLTATATVSAEVIALAATIEAEGAQLEPEERAQLFSELGWGEGALAKMVQTAYRALDLETFYTVGPKEAHAWTIPHHATAPTAAGKIHSDLERGFIRAEICGLEEVISAGGWDAAKRENLVRVEGKDYRMASREVMLVRFAV